LVVVVVVVVVVVALEVVLSDGSVNVLEVGKFSSLSSFLRKGQVAEISSSNYSLYAAFS